MTSKPIPYTARTWPETPFTLIKTTSYLRHHPSLPPAQDAIRVARLMALTHNTVFRALNAVYTQASAVFSPQDTRDLATFARFAVAFLENHHKCEELVFFPMLEAQSHSPGSMETNVAEHRAFDAPLGALRGYLDAVRAGTTDRYNAEVLRGLIDALAGPLQRHLDAEIPSILEAGKCMGDEAMRACYKALHDEAEGTTDPYQIGPLVMGCQDSTLLVDGYRVQFPELPFSLAPYLVDYIVSRRYAGAWRFCPSSFHGEPRETEFFTFDGSVPMKIRKDGGALGISLFWFVFLVLLVAAGYMYRQGNLPWDGFVDWKVADWEAKIGNFGRVTRGEF